ncbi:MAG: YgeY family selenium metabolism-linked hydrolase [Actinobacteria bacterium]|nr:YgeY family selenium metabolism-linked hydrolase [Actinomycetota bacterium]
MTELMDAARRHRDGVTHFLRELVAIPSLSGEEGDVARRIVAEMEVLGYAHAFTDAMGNVIGRIGDGPTKVVFDAHMDTVGVGDPGAWEYDPFTGKVADGVVYGRGASDNKGAIASQVYAGALIQERGLDGAGVTVYVVGTVMEESSDGLALGYVLSDTLRDVDAVVLGECTGLAVYRGHRGRMEMRTTIKGTSAHASAPERGENAISAMAPLLREIDELHTRLGSDDFLGKGSIAATNIECTTASLNAIPDSCTIHLDRRLTFGDTLESATAEIAALPSAARATIEVPGATVTSYTGHQLAMDAYFPTWVLDEDHPLVRAGLDAGKVALGAVPATGKWTFSTNGVSSAGRLGIPTIGFGPSEEKWAHTVLDQCPIDHLVASIAFYTALPPAIERQGIGR